MLDSSSDAAPPLPLAPKDAESDQLLSSIVEAEATRLSAETTSLPTAGSSSSSGPVDAITGASEAKIPPLPASTTGSTHQHSSAGQPTRMLVEEQHSGTAAHKELSSGSFAINRSSSYRESATEALPGKPFAAAVPAKAQAPPMAGRADGTQEGSHVARAPTRPANLHGRIPILGPGDLQRSRRSSSLSGGGSLSSLPPGIPAAARPSSRLARPERTFTASLARPTQAHLAALAAGRAAVEQRQQRGKPSAHTPKATKVKPFRLATTIRREFEKQYVNDDALLTTEERTARQAEREREKLRSRLASSRVRAAYKKVLEPARPASAPPKPPRQPLETQEFKLRSKERHAQYAAKIASKVAAEAEQAKPPAFKASPFDDKIKAGVYRHATPHEHKATAAKAALFHTASRVAVHRERDDLRRALKEAEAAQREAERVAQLSKEEREEEELRRQHLFKARPMPSFDKVFKPDPSKAAPATQTKAFRFHERFGSPLNRHDTPSPDSSAHCTPQQKGSSTSMSAGNSWLRAQPSANSRRALFPGSA